MRISDWSSDVCSSDLRRLFAQLAAKFFAPFPKTVVAVTGTNGKTSTVELTRQIWHMMGETAASHGTLGVTPSVDQVSTGHTTPDIVTSLSTIAGLSSAERRVGKECVSTFRSRGA